MASLIDFYKQKLAPKLTNFLNTQVTLPKPLVNVATNLANANPGKIISQGLLNNQPLQKFSQAGLRTGYQVNTNPQQFNVLSAGLTGRNSAPEPIRQAVGQGLESASFGLLRNRVPQPTTTAGKVGKFAGGVVGSIPAFTAGTALLGGTTRNIGNLGRLGRTALDLGVGATSMALTTPGSLKERAASFKENVKDPLQIAMSLALPFGANAVAQSEKKVVARKVGEALKKELEKFDLPKIDISEKPKWNMRVKTIYQQVDEPLFKLRNSLKEQEARVIANIKQSYDRNGKIDSADALDIMELFKRKIKGVRHDKFTPEVALEEMWQHAKNNQVQFASDIKTPKLSVEPTGKLQELETASKELGQAMNDTSKVDAVYQKYIGGKATNFTSKLDAIRTKMVTTNNDLYSARYAASKRLSVEPTGGKDLLSEARRQGGIGDINDVKARLLNVFTFSESDKLAIRNAKTPEELAPYLRKLNDGSLAKFFNSGAGTVEHPNQSKPLSVEPVGGKPIKAFHGTAKDFNFSDFNESMRGVNGESSQVGYHFSVKPDEAKIYAGEAVYSLDPKSYESGNRGVVKEVTLDIRNPKRLPAGQSTARIERVKQAKAEGYDSVIDDSGNIVVFDKKQVIDSPSPLGGKPVAQGGINDIVRPDQISEMGRVKTKEIDNVFKKIPDGTVSPDGYVVKRGDKLYPTEKATPEVLKNSRIELNPDGSYKESNFGVHRMSFTEDVALPSLSPSKGGVTEPKIVKPLKEVYKEKLTTGENIPQLSTPQETSQQISKLVQPISEAPKLQSELPTVQRVNKSTKLDPTSESIIQEARKQIGESSEPPKANLKQTFDNLYTQWVDRYNPITQASKKAQGALKEQGAVLRPEYDPTYLVRRLTGAGGIADQRFQTQLNPILKEMEQLNIPKADMDVYLANRRIAGFGTAGRDIYGADPKKASEVVSALNAKYPNIDSVAQKFYTYQDEGLKEISDAGFLSPEDMAKIKSQNPDYSPLYRVMDEMDEYLGLPTRKTQQATSPITKIKGSTRQIESPVESIIGNTFRQRAAIEKNRVAQSIVNLQKVADMGFEKVAKSGTDTISVWNNGKKEFWKVGQDIADTAKGVNEESMNVVLKLLQAPASLLRQGATGRNPEFMTPNIIRDQLDAAVTSKYGYIPFVDYLSGLKSMLTNDEVYQKWANSGAKIDLGELSGKKSIKQLFDSKVQKKKLGGWISQGLDVLGKYSEQPTRVGLFKKAYNKTGNELIAALESRDATVDFARMGSKMKVANSIVPFLNVGVQGFDKLIRSVKDNPGKVAFNLSTYAVAPQVMSTMYNLIKYPEEYQEIPQYEKDANFVFVQGRNEDGTVNYITIPKGNIVPVAANPTQNFLEYAFSNNPQSFKEMALNTLSGTLPVLGQGSSLKEIGIKTIGQNLPQAIKPITENLLNKSFYKYDPKKEQNKDIVPSYLQNKPAYLQKYDFTPKMYEKIGAALNVSPLKVQNLMEGYLAGYSKIPAQILDSMNTISQGKEVSNNNKTILRRFVKTTYPSSSKPAPETPPVPSFMERITGKAGASEKAGKDKTYWYTDDSGNSKSIKIGKVTSLPESTNYERVKKDQEKWKLADDILNLPAEQQQKAFTDLGISKADAEYYQVAKDTTEAKVAYIKDQVQGVKTYEEFLKKVIPLAKEINGSAILSSGVIDWLYNNDIITSAQKKQLKSLEFKDGKVQIKSGSTKSKYVEAKLPASAKTALPKVKRIRTKTYKLVVPKTK